MQSPRLPWSTGLAAAFLSLVARCQEPLHGGPWITLFDGKSTDAWRSYGGEAFPQKGWLVEDGALRVQAGDGGGDIVTRETFADFELRFEWRVAAGANSGVFYRVGDGDDAVWRSGPEYQVLDDAGHPDGRDARTSAASLYGLIAGENRVAKPVGEFNEGRIVCRGGRVEHWLNGSRVLDFDWGSPAMVKRIAESKFASMPKFATLAAGRIALQDHGDDVWYRNIRIRRFEGREEKRLFDGKSLTGLTSFLHDGAAIGDVFSVTDEGVLVCRGNPIGYVRTASDWENFILHVEWRFDPVTKKAGNSGVLFRMTGEDKVWPKSLEAQLQSGSAGDFWKIDGFRVDCDAQRENGRNVKRVAAAERPIGEWNNYEIEVDGGDVELRINGVVVNFGRNAEPGAGKICLQSEGAEIHFRNWTVIPLQR